MLEPKLGFQKLNYQENFSFKGINEENTLNGFNALNSNNDTLTIYFQNLEKKMFLYIVVTFILLGGYICLEY